MPRMDHLGHGQDGRRELREQAQWLVFPLVRLLFLASAAEVMHVRLGLPMVWVLPSLFLSVLASAMVSSLAEGGLDEQAAGLAREAECLLRALLVMASVLVSLSGILSLLRHV